jgi:hypothetical protein
MLIVHPLPHSSAVVSRLRDAGLIADTVDGEPEVYAVQDGLGRVAHIRVRGDGPPDLIERVWRVFDDQPPDATLAAHSSPE